MLLKNKEEDGGGAEGKLENGVVELLIEDGFTTQITTVQNANWQEDRESQVLTTQEWVIN
ncbi:hypothetical protein C5167_007678 [Papaver somniferum]|nr:hypothetical protein C5167_007678 [Papaver somniferum]